MERELVLVAGLPGTGKSTLSKNITAELQETKNIEHISSGDLVRAIGSRAIFSSHSDLITAHLNSREALFPLPFEIVTNIIQDALLRNDTSQLILLDGYPRHREQLSSLQQFLAENQRQMSAALITEASREVAISRLLHREVRPGSLPLTHQSALLRHSIATTLLEPLIEHLNSTELPIYRVSTESTPESAKKSALNFLSHHLTTLATK